MMLLLANSSNILLVYQWLRFACYHVFITFSNLMARNVIFGPVDKLFTDHQKLQPLLTT